MRQKTCASLLPVGFVSDITHVYQSNPHTNQKNRSSIIPELTSSHHKSRRPRALIRPLKVTKAERVISSKWKQLLRHPDSRNCISSSFPVFKKLIIYSFKKKQGKPQKASINCAQKSASTGRQIAECYKTCQIQDWFTSKESVSPVLI